MKIKNLTGHQINICKQDGSLSHTFESEGELRCFCESKLVCEIENTPVFENTYSITMPFSTVMQMISDCDAIIVSKITADALRSYGIEKPMYIVAGTIKNEDGVIIGTKGLAKY